MRKGISMVLVLVLQSTIVVSTGLDSAASIVGRHESRGKQSSGPGGMKTSKGDKPMPGAKNGSGMSGMNMDTTKGGEAVPGSKNGSRMGGMNMDMPGSKNGSGMSGMNMDMPGMNMGVRPITNIADDKIGRWLSVPLEHNSDTISLNEVEKLAQEHNPTIVQARAHIAAAEGQALQAGLFPNPALNYNGDLMGLPGPGNGAGEFQGGIIDQEIILGGKLKLSREKYKARAEAARKQAAAQSFRVANDAKIHFYKFFAAYEKVYIQKQMLKSMQDRWLTINEMVNLGQANQADLHRTNVGLEQHKLNVLESENELKYAWQELTAVAGVDLSFKNPSGMFEGEPQALSWELTLKNLMDHSPQLAQAHAKLKSDEVTLKREKRQKIPDLVLSGGAGYDPLDKGFASKVNLGVVNIPLFDRNQGTVKQAEADLERQRAQVRLVELTLRKTLAEKFKDYMTAVQHVQAFRSTILPESEKRYIIMLNSYRNTRAEWMDVLEAQRDFFALRLAYIKHLLSWHESEIAINGFVLTGALDAPPGIDPPGHIDAVPKPR